jgi:hypothetical protein
MTSARTAHLRLIGAVILGALVPRVASADEPEPSGATTQPLPGAPVLPPSPAPSSADKVAPGTDPIDAPAKYRSGVCFGASFGLGTFTVAGYPNSALRLNDPAYHYASGPVVAFADRLFLMGALADTFNFGIWLGGMTGENDKTKALASGGGFRMEAFPLFHVAPQLRNFGFIAQVGVGGAIADKKMTLLSVDGTQSFLGAGALYEFKHGHFIGLHSTIGVELEYQYVTSQSIDSHGVFAAARFAFYGGP